MKTCTKCGQEKPLDHFHRDGKRADGLRSWCKPCNIAAVRRRQAEYRLETGERYQDRHIEIGSCGDCGTSLRLRPGRRVERCRACQCRAIAAERSERSRRRRLPVLYEGEPFQPKPKPLGALPPLRRCWYMGFCARCGEAFIHDQPQTLTCTTRCARYLAKGRRRARKRDAFVADVSPRQIFERDRWTCQLCGKRVAWSKSVPHPKASVIDHIVPLAGGRENGGVHAPYNVQTAHFLCNSIKCAEFDQAALF